MLINSKNLKINIKLRSHDSLYVQVFEETKMLDRKFSNTERYQLMQEAGPVGGGSTAVGEMPQRAPTTEARANGDTSITEARKTTPTDFSGIERVYRDGDDIKVKITDPVGNTLANFKALNNTMGDLQTAMMKAEAAGNTAEVSVLKTRFESMKQLFKFLEEMNFGVIQYSLGLNRLASQAFGGLQFQ
jgi:hypothetical protein